MSDEKTVKFVEALELSMRASAQMDKIDDRQLLWLLEKTFFQPADLDIFSYSQSLVNQIEDRLYPEYDGEKVTMTDWGWTTPEGDVIYDRKKYEAEKRKSE